MGQAIGAAAGGAASAGGGSFLGTLFGAGGGFSSFLAGPGPGMILQIGLSLLARRKRKKEEERRIREGIEITGSPSIDFAPIVLGRRQVEQGVVVLKGNVVVNAGGRGWFQYTEVQAWAAAGRGGIGGIKSVWLDEDEYVVDAGNGIGGTGSDFVLYDPSSVPNAPTAPRNQWRYAIVEFPTYGESGKSEWANNRKWGYRSGAGAAANEAPGFELTVYDGSQTAADPGLVAKGSELHDWDRDFIGRNFAYTVMVFTRHGQNLSLWDKRGFPKIRVVLEGDKVPLTKAVQNTPASWTFSRNPAYLATYAHFELPVGTSIDANTPIDWTRVAAAATTADQTLTIPAGTIKGVAQSNTTEKRYNADVVVQGSATPAEIISQLELACDGDYLKVDGSWALEIPTSEADSGIELVDEMLASRATLIAGENLSSRFTSIAAAYIAPNENWKRVFTPEYESSTLLSKEGRALPRQDIALDAVTSPTQAWRLLLRQAYREEMQEQISIEGFHDLLRIRRGVNFKYKSDNLGISSFKRFVAENVSTESGSSPVVIVAREEDRARVYADPAIGDYPVYTDDQLVLPDTPPFPVQAMTARGVSGGIQLAITMPDIPGRIEIYDSPTSAWADASLKLVTTDSLVHIDYDAGTTRWFWARNNIGGEVSTRFPNDDVSTITATVPAAADVRTARIIKAVIGNAPPNDEWVAGVLWIDPGNGRQWRGEPDPWVAFPQPGTYVASTKTVTWDDSKQNLVLGSDLSWTTAGGGTPSYGLLNTLLAVRGMANVVGLNTGVQFALESGITSFTATDFYGFVIDQKVPDTVFVDGTENAVLNSIDINLATSVVSAVFRDDVTGNPQTGPNFRKPGSSYTFVVRLGTTVYALPVRSGDDEDPYALVPPTGFLAAVRARRTAVIAGNTVPNASVALVDETPWTHGTDWAQAFNTVTRQERREYVTVFTGTDDVSPFTWPSVGIIPDFIDGSMQVLQLDKTRRNWTANQLSRWVTIPEQAIEEIFTATEDRPLTDDQLPFDDWIYLQIEDAPETLGVPPTIWADDLATAGFSSKKEYGWRATRLVPVGSEPWRVSFWGHWGAGAPVQAISRRQYGERAPIAEDGGWAFRDDDTSKTNLLGNWEKIKTAAFLDLSYTDEDGWPVLEQNRVRVGDVIVAEPVDNQFASFAVTKIENITGGKRFSLRATERYSDGDGSDIDGNLRIYFPRLTLPKPSEAGARQRYNDYGDDDDLPGGYRFFAGTSAIGFDAEESFKEIVVGATRVVLSQRDVSSNAAFWDSVDAASEPVLVFTLKRDEAWAAWKATVGPYVAGTGYDIALTELVAYENESPSFVGTSDDVYFGMTDFVRVASSQLDVVIRGRGDIGVGGENVELPFVLSGEALREVSSLTALARVTFNGAQRQVAPDETNRKDGLTPGTELFAATMPNPDNRGGKIDVKLPTNPPTNLSVQVFLDVRYPPATASDSDTFLLRIGGTAYEARANVVFERASQGYSFISGHVATFFAKGPESFTWQQYFPDSGIWDEVLLPISFREYSLVGFNRRRVAFAIPHPHEELTYQFRCICSDTFTESTSTVATVVVPAAAGPSGQSGPSGQAGPSGAQDTPAQADILELSVGDRRGLSMPGAKDFSISGNSVEMELATGGPVLQAVREGTSYLRSNNAQGTALPAIGISVSSAVPTNRLDLVLEAPKALPAGETPIQLRSGVDGDRIGQPYYGHSIASGPGKLSDYVDGQEPSDFASDNPGPYLVPPDTVAADVDTVVEGSLRLGGFEVTKSATIKITRLGYPNPPTALVVSSVTSSGFSLAWTAAASETGKANATGYRVVVTAKDTGIEAARYTPTGTTQAVTGLAAETEYTLEVTTDSDSDFSRTSLTGEQTTSSATGTGTLPVPLAPTNLRFFFVSDTAMTLSWVSPTAASARAATTGYRVRVRTGDAVTGTLVQTQTTPSPSLRLTGLSATTFYYLEVQANSAAGYSASLRGTQFTTSPLPVPLAPTAMTFSNVAQNSLTIGWTASAASSTRSAVTGYRVRLYRGLSIPSGTLVFERTVTSETTSQAVTGLVYDTWYVASVEAGSASGFSPVLTDAQRTSQALVPNPPTALTFSSIAQTTLTVGWTAPATATDKAPVTGYRLRFRTGSASGTIAQTLTPGASAASQAVTGLSPNTTYYVSLEANSNRGYSTALTGTTKTLEPLGTITARWYNDGNRYFPPPAQMDEGVERRFRLLYSTTGIVRGTPRYSFTASLGSPRTKTGTNFSASYFTYTSPSVASDTNVTLTGQVEIGDIVSNVLSSTILVKNRPTTVTASIAAWNYQASYSDRYGRASSRIYASFPEATAPTLPNSWFGRPVRLSDRKVRFIEMSITDDGSRGIFLMLTHATSTSAAYSPRSTFRLRVQFKYTDASSTEHTLIVDPWISTWRAGRGMTRFWTSGRRTLNVLGHANMTTLVAQRARVPMTMEIVLWP